MLFESTTILLRSIVTSLESGGEPGWDDQLEFGNQCLYELHQMSRSSSRTAKADNVKFQVVTPPFERAIRAIPHVKSMMRAIRQHNQVPAVESGRVALAEMNGIRAIVQAPKPAEVAPAPATPPVSQPVTQPEAPAKKAAHRHKNAVSKKRPVVAKRKSSLIAAASTR